MLYIKLFYSAKKLKERAVKNTFSIIFWNMLVLAICLVGIELVWGGWFKPTNLNTLNLVRNQQWQFDVSKLYPRAEKTRYTRDENAFRGEYSAPEEIDILTVGGSTTDQRYIDDAETWQAAMRTAFKNSGRDINIVNAGVDGQSTLGHLKNFSLWFANIPNLTPRYILFYIGVNDFYRTEADKRFDALESNWKQDIKNRSALYYLWRTLYGTYHASVVNPVAHVKGGIKAEELKWTDKGLIEQNYAHLMAVQLENYASRIKALAKEAKKLGATPIFVTQKTRQYKVEAGKVLGITNKPDVYQNMQANGVDKFYMMNLLNATAMQTCAQIQKAICIDLASGLPLSIEEDYYDYVHNTPTGAQKIGEYLYNKLEVLF